MDSITQVEDGVSRTISLNTNILGIANGNNFELNYVTLLWFGALAAAILTLMYLLFYPSEGYQRVGQKPYLDQGFHSEEQYYQTRYRRVAPTNGNVVYRFLKNLLKLEVRI